MGENKGPIFLSMVKAPEQVGALMEKLLGVAHPSAVYGAPWKAGEYTIITASEIGLGMGISYGSGFHSPAADKAPAEGEPTEMGVENPDSGGMGGGGGGGVNARPVAVISVGPEGVQVQPVVDATKIGLAFVTMLGSLLLMLSRMRRS